MNTLRLLQLTALAMDYIDTPQSDTVLEWVALWKLDVLGGV